MPLPYLQSIFSPVFMSQAMQTLDCVVLIVRYVCVLSCVQFFCDLMDYSLPGSSLHGIFQAGKNSVLPFPTPADLPYPGVEPMSLASPVLVSEFFTTGSPGKPPN